MSKPRWRRYRLKTYAEDFRPIAFNPHYPWWCSGHGGDDGDEYHVIVAWLPVGEKIQKYWDDAFDVEFSDHDAIAFTDRFAKPAYYKESP